VFGGRVPTEPRGMMEKAMVEGVPEQFRERGDWDAIRAWAAEIARDLTPIRS
jgi:hypothetical protein